MVGTKLHKVEPVQANQIQEIFSQPTCSQQPAAFTYSTEVRLYILYNVDKYRMRQITLDNLNV
jgi:hypothetical protein